MTDIEKQPGAAGPQVMLRGLLVVVALAVAAALGLMYYHKVSKPQAEGPQQVAMLDSDSIYAMKEFTDVKKELEALSKEYEERLKNAKTKTAEELERMRMQMRVALETESAKRVKPLRDRVAASIAAVASEKKYRVVLDKRIVVTGVVDITEDVKKKFAETKAGDPLKVPDTESHVGYVNEEVIGELTIYKKANADLLETYKKMGEDFQKRAKDLKADSDKEKLRGEMVRLFEEEKRKAFETVNAKVSEAITSVAKEKGLSLVLNSQHIMWGGRNLTDDVIKKLIQAKS